MLRRLKALSRNELEAIQRRKLDGLLARVHANSRYYRRKMVGAGIAPGKLRSIEDFTGAFPLSDKAEFLRDQNEAPPFGERLSISASEIALVNLTGGTSGQGQEFYGRTQRDVHLLGYLHALPWFLSGLRAGDVAINCVPAGGMTTGGWGPGEGIRIIGATGFHVGGNLSTEAKIDLMRKVGRVNFIYASTNYLHTLTEALIRKGIDPKEAFPDMRSIFIAAEGYPAEWAARIEALWGCRLNEGYGSTQCVGFGASTCDSGVLDGDGKLGLMRFFEWETMFEVLDPATLKPVRSGEVGEIVITNLSVEGSPVIRFRTGDAARFYSWRDIGDGRSWNGIECGTIGRFDDMMKIRGNNVWPSAVDAAVFAFSEVAEYTGRLYTSAEGKTEIEVKIAFAEDFAGEEPAVRSGLIDAVRARIKERTNVWMDLVQVDKNALPEFSYKARRWKDERGEGYKL
jgi:phenylacetate-CoA ligase